MRPPTARGRSTAPWTIDTLLAADKGDGSGAWFMSLMTQAIFPRVQVWGDVAAVARADAAHARRFFATHADRGSVIGSPGTDFLTAGGRLFDSWPASPDENRVHPRPGLERRDAPDRRQARRRDAAPERDARAAAASAERPGGRAAGHRPHGRLLDLPDAGKQPADQHVPRQRPGRHVALHAHAGRLHARARPWPDRHDRPRLDAGAGRADGALACLDGASRAMARSVRTQEQCGAPGRVSARARARRSVPRRPDRADDERRCRSHRRAGRRALRERADRARRLPRLGEPRLGHPGATRDSPRQWEAPSSGRGSGST